MQIVLDLFPEQWYYNNIMRNNYFHIGVDRGTNLCYTVYVNDEKGLNNYV